MNANNMSYKLSAESDTSMVIKHFDEEFVLDIVLDNLDRRINIYQPNLPNIISSIEQNFKILYNNESVRINNGPEVLAKRNNIYNVVLNMLLKNHNLVLESDMEYNIYTLSYYLYDFLISNFKKYMIDFFARFIHREVDDIYKSLNLDEDKRNRDSTIMHSKKIYVNPKMPAIIANLGYIISNMSEINISLKDILQSTYGDINILNFLNTFITDNGNFFKDVYIGIYNSVDNHQSILTDIRFAIHELELNNIRQEGVM